jgi:pyruvate ferredoxin oxidoreductase gamma subunit
VQKNLAHALPAFDALAAQAGSVKESVELGPAEATRPDWVEMPVDDARLSAPEIRASATSELANTGVWRTFRPVIDYHLCKRCSWVCSTLCPDSAIEVEPDRTPRIDYDHCKGCMVCVAVCPPHAIRVEPEPARASA